MQLDNNKVPINIFLDLSKAFDTINHTILLDKLQHYGIRNTALKLFNSYADDTTLFATIEALSPNPDNVSNVINDELCKVDKWLQINKLSLNIQKPKFIIYIKTNKKTVDPILQIKHTAIERVDHFNFLGLTIDSQLTRKNHIQ